MNSNRRILLWIGLGAVLVVALVGFCIGGFALLFFQGYRSVSPAAVSIQEDWRAGDHDAVHAAMSAGTQARQSREAYQEVMDKIEGAAGRPQSWSIRSLNVRQSGGNRTTRLAYAVRFEQESGVVEMVLASQNGEWRLLDLRASSPRIREAFGEGP